MHPAGLGHVQAVMSLTGSELQVSLTPETDHGHAALAGAVNDLKNELARGGVNVNIDLRHSQSQTSSDDRRPKTSDTQARPTERTATFVTPTSTARDAGQIHLML
jgi:flagellar hook-length control protein FliK